MRSGLWWLKGPDQACGALFWALSLFAKRPLHPVIKDYDPGFMVYIPSEEWAAIHVVWTVQPQAMGLSLFLSSLCLESLGAWLAIRSMQLWNLMCFLRKASDKDLHGIFFTLWNLCTEMKQNAFVISCTCAHFVHVLFLVCDTFV